MEEIEVGEYVRANNGLLGRVNKIELKGSGIRYAGELIADTIIQFNDGKVYERRVKDKDIVNHSKNIIDLLQEGDFANGYKIIRINYIDKWIVIQNINEFSENGKKVLLENEIKTILTKELYQANCYTVERKK